MNNPGTTGCREELGLCKTGCKNAGLYNLGMRFDILNIFLYAMNLFQCRWYSVVVITFPLHGKGPGFGSQYYLNGSAFARSFCIFLSTICYEMAERWLFSALGTPCEVPPFCAKTLRWVTTLRLDGHPSRLPLLLARFQIVVTLSSCSAVLRALQSIPPSRAQCVVT